MPVLASQARTLLSGDAERMRSPSLVQCSSRIAFLWPGRKGLILKEKSISVVQMGVVTFGEIRRSSQRCRSETVNNQEN